MSRQNPKLEQYKKILRPVLEATAEVFCARLDAEINALLNEPGVNPGVIIGLRSAIDLIHSEAKL